MTDISPQSNRLNRANRLNRVLPIPARTPESTPSSAVPTGLVRAGWLWSGILGGLAASVALSTQAAWSRPVLNDTRHFLVAQQVVDGLPPPPPVVPGQETLTGQAQRYLVLVNSDSDMMLSQVQQIQPTASMQDYNGQRFIQAGLFSDLATAQQQASTLAAAGIGAQVVTVTGTESSVSQSSYNTASTNTYDVNSSEFGTLPPPQVLPTTSVPSSPGEVEFGSPDSGLDTADPEERGSRGSRSYYVVIPSGGRNLEAVTGQISRLTEGMGIDGMVQTGTAQGSHVRVGPFNSRSAANRWTRYFRDFGMDARVSYSR